MTASLREELRAFLGNWRADLSPAWNVVLADVAPAYEAVRADLAFDPAEPIYPGRKGRPLSGAPPGAHVFRALDGLAPEDVRVVIVGQDPYPKIAQATGRAFEQGDLRTWSTKGVAISLRRIVQVLVAARTGNPAYATSDADWKRLTADLDAGTLDLDAPPALFDRLQGEGVLLLNAALTITRYERSAQSPQITGHIPLWRPVMAAILRHLAAHPGRGVVFALWGGPAQAVFEQQKVRDAAEAAGTWGTRVAVARHSHPNAYPRKGGSGRPFFAPPNPFLEVNRHLQAMGAPSVAW